MEISETGSTLFSTFGFPLFEPLATITEAENPAELFFCRSPGAGVDGKGLYTPEGFVVLAGSVGTPERWEFGVVGDTVNCAARIEGLQREQEPSPPCRVLLSGTTLALVRATIQGPWKLWGTLPLSGRSTAVEIGRAHV